jgi:hypothetical protein
LLIRGRSQMLVGRVGLRALAFQRSDLVGQARFAVAFEAADLTLERADAVVLEQRLPGRLRRGVGRALLRRARQPLLGQRLGLRSGCALRLRFE